MKLKQILWVTILSGTIGWLSAALQAQPEPSVDMSQTDNPPQNWQSDPPAPAPRNGDGPRWNRQRRNAAQQDNLNQRPNRQRRNAAQQDDLNQRPDRPRRNQVPQDNFDQGLNRPRQGNQAQAGPARRQGQRDVNRQQFDNRDFSARPQQRQGLGRDQGLGRGQGLRQRDGSGPVGPRQRGQGLGQGRGRDGFRDQDITQSREFRRGFALGLRAGQSQQALRGLGNMWRQRGNQAQQPYGYGPAQPRGQRGFDAQQGPNFRGPGRGQGWQNRRGFGGPDGVGPPQFTPQRRNQGFGPRGNQGFEPGRDAFQGPRGNRAPYRRMQDDAGPEMMPPLPPLTEGPDEFIAPEEDFPYFEESVWSDDMEI